ncbi:MAG: hypothetical protein QG608_47 [Actinomycetota bacterium]|nr:hypothetical protein [Actinomycetota bacterium]
MQQNDLGLCRPEPGHDPFLDGVDRPTGMPLMVVVPQLGRSVRPGPHEIDAVPLRPEPAPQLGPITTGDVEPIGDRIPQRHDPDNSPRQRGLRGPGAGPGILPQQHRQTGQQTGQQAKEKVSHSGRADHLSSYGNGRRTVPRKDGGGRRFDLPHEDVP